MSKIMDLLPIDLDSVDLIRRNISRKVPGERRSCYRCVGDLTSLDQDLLCYLKETRQGGACPLNLHPRWMRKNAWRWLFALGGKKLGSAAYSLCGPKESLWLL